MPPKSGRPTCFARSFPVGPDQTIGGSFSRAPAAAAAAGGRQDGVQYAIGPLSLSAALSGALALVVTRTLPAGGDLERNILVCWKLSRPFGDERLISPPVLLPVLFVGPRGLRDGCEPLAGLRIVAGQFCAPLCVAADESARVVWRRATRQFRPDRTGPERRGAARHLSAKSPLESSRVESSGLFGEEAARAPQQKSPPPSFWRPQTDHAGCRATRRREGAKIKGELEFVFQRAGPGRR